MARHRKPGRPKGRKSRKKDSIIGCSTVTVYRRRKGRVQKIKGKIHKKCLTK